MKKIMFRAKTLSGRWVNGDLHLMCRTPHIHCPDSNLIKTDTIGQFTCLKDKNGVEIYEGDIMRMHTFLDVTREPYYEDDFYLDRSTYGVVKITPGRGAILTRCVFYEDNGEFGEKRYMPDRPKRVKLAAYRSEVVGNIYDNPELLIPKPKEE